MGSATFTVLVDWEDDCSTRALILTLPTLPSLVLTSITPLSPRAPYKAVALASFKKEKLAISSICKRARSEADNSTLSIRISGEELYPKVVTPLIKKDALSCPG